MALRGRRLLSKWSETVLSGRQLPDLCLKGSSHGRPVDGPHLGPTGNPIGEPLGHDDWVTPVALGRLGDRDVIVSGGSTTVRIWETTGHPVGTRYAPSSRALGSRSKRVASFSQLARRCRSSNQLRLVSECDPYDRAEQTGVSHNGPRPLQTHVQRACPALTA
jgi:hypothetical protein